MAERGETRPEIETGLPSREIEASTNPVVNEFDARVSPAIHEPTQQPTKTPIPETATPVKESVTDSEIVGLSLDHIPAENDIDLEKLEASMFNSSESQ